MGTKTNSNQISSPSVIYKYTPHRMSREDLLGTFVGRQELVPRLVEHLRSQRGRKKPQHTFIWGPRGMGKTTLLLVLRHTLADDPGLSQVFEVVQSNEEERQVANLPTLAVRLLELIGEARTGAQREAVDEDIQRVRDEPERAMDVLLEAGARLGDRQVVLLLDNFDELAIAATSAKTKSFRKNKTQMVKQLDRLLSSPHFLVVAMALQPPQKRKDFPRDLVQRFSFQEPLNPLEDPMALLRRRAKQDRREGFLQKLPELASRVDGLNRLAAGNPRLLVFLYECLGQRHVPELVEIVKQIVDVLTPMYQDVLDSLLNRGQAAVLENLVQMGGVGRAKQIADRTFQDETTVRDALTRLCDLGMVIRQRDMDLPGKPDPDRRPQVYRTHPPLFQVWYEMRFMHTERSLFLVRFFSLLTDRSEAQDALKELSQAPRAMSQRVLSEVVDLLDPEWAELQAEHVSGVLNSGGSLGDAVKQLSQALEQTSEQSIRRRMGLFVIRSETRWRLGDPEGAEVDLALADELAVSAPEPETRIKLLLSRSRLHRRKSQLDLAVENSQEAVALCNGLASSCKEQLIGLALLELTSVYIDKRDLNSASKSFQMMTSHLEEKNLQTMSGFLKLTGNIARITRNNETAREWFEDALAQAKEHGERVEEASILNNLSLSFMDSGIPEQAREYAEKALTISQDIDDQQGEASSLVTLAKANRLLSRLKQARTLARRAMENYCSSGDQAGIALCNFELGMLALIEGDYDEADILHRKAIAIFKKLGDRRSVIAGLSSLAVVLDAKEDPQAPIILQQAFDSCADILTSLGKLRKEEAIIPLRTQSALYLKRGNLNLALDRFQFGHELASDLEDRGPVKFFARGIVETLTRLMARGAKKDDWFKAEARIDQALTMVEDAGVEEAMSMVVVHLLVPVLRRSTRDASKLRALLERAKLHSVLITEKELLVPLMTLLRYYEEGRSRAVLDEIGPTEMSLSLEVLIDRIDRPKHAQASALMRGGNFEAAKALLERILNQDPKDKDACLQLAEATLALGELEAAQQQVDKLLAQDACSTPALLLKARILLAEGKHKAAADVLRPLTESETPDPEAFRLLATALRYLQRYTDLAHCLERWRDTTANEEDEEHLAVQIPEAYLLAGDVALAREGMPDDSRVVKQPWTKLHLGLFRVLFSLLDRTPESARDHAAATLSLATQLPPASDKEELDSELVRRAQDLLDGEDRKFFKALIRAVERRQDPMAFAEQYLGQEEVQQLSDRAAQEGQAALEALEQGRIQTFDDLFRIATRSVGPAAAISALAGAYQEQPRARQRVLAELWIVALEQGRPAEAVAALGALGQNFTKLESQQRQQALSAIQQMVSRGRGDHWSREQALEVLDALYPNLESAERVPVREALESLQGQLRSPALDELLNHTIPQVDKEAP